jgi:hypothetical protein
MKTIRKYTTIQLDREIHTLLKNYCKANRRSLSGYVEMLILTSLKSLDTTNTLKVDKIKP